MFTHRLLKVFAFFTLVVIASVSWRPAYAQSMLVVDDDGQASATDCNATQNSYNGIQEATDAAVPGDAIFICPGIYHEQVVITTSNLIIRGSGMGTTIIRPTDVRVNSTGTNTPFPVAAIVLVDQATGVNIKDLTVDGSLADGGAANLFCLEVGFYMGIYYRNGSGTVAATHVTDILSAARCSAGLSVSSSFGSASDLVIQDSVFEEYGSEGVRCNGANAVCRVISNTFRGRGPVADQIQGGIIFRLGAGGEISGNIIMDHFYTPAVGMSEFSVGIALFNAEPNLNPHLTQKNSFIRNQIDVQRNGTAQTFE